MPILLADMTRRAAGARALYWRHSRKLWLALIAALLIPIAALAAVAQSVGPGGYDRWLGALEGSEGTRSGGAIMYDLHFEPDGTGRVERSAGTEKLVQQYRWSLNGDAVVLAMEGTTLPELTGAEAHQLDSHHVSIKLANGAILKLRPSVAWITWLHYLFFAVIVIFLGNELARRSRVAAYVLFLVFPIALLPLWLRSDFDTVFRWVKLYSAITGACLFTLFRFNGLDRFGWVKGLVAAVLAVNITEAVIQDIDSGALANWLNAFAGILNIITIHRWWGIRRDEAKPHDMLWPGMTVSWIIAYDAWNLTFVYLNFPNTILFTIAIVIAPTLAAMFVKKGTWMQARAYTLAIYMMYIFSFQLLLENKIGLYLTVPLPRSEGIALAIACGSLAINLGYALYHFRWRFTGRAPRRLEIGQSESVI